MNKSPDLEVAAALLLVLDQVDYTKGACSPTDMGAACLPTQVIDTARRSIITRNEVLYRIYQIVDPTRTEMHPDAQMQIMRLLWDAGFGKQEAIANERSKVKP